MIALLAAVPWGSLLGGAFAWLQRREEREKAKAEHAQKVELMKLQQAGAINAAEWAGFSSSHASAAAEDGSGVWRWVKSLRYGTRSGLTWLLVIAAVVIALRSPIASDLPGRVVFFAEMALGWHFGWKVSGRVKTG